MRDFFNEIVKAENQYLSNNLPVLQYFREFIETWPVAVFKSNLS